MLHDLVLPIIKVFQLALYFVGLNRYAERPIDSCTLITPLLRRHLRNQNIFCILDDLIRLQLAEVLFVFLILISNDHVLMSALGFVIVEINILPDGFDQGAFKIIVVFIALSLLLFW